MFKLRNFSFTLIFFPLIVYSAVADNLTKYEADRFISHLVLNDDSLKFYLDPSELRQSERLGIDYQGVTNKFLISYGLSSNLIMAIQSGNYKYRIDSLGDSFSRLSIFVPDEGLQQDYFFLHDKLVSPFTYYSKNWKRIESEYFVFVVSDSIDCNPYSIAVLDAFVGKMIDKLELDKNAKEILKREKIFYYLCKDDNEIERLTGFKTRGIYNLAYDCVVSTYRCHYHELLHLLMNYRLRNLPLYTHPFLQEGFAVAFGGRGGLDPHIVLEAGTYIVESGIADYSEFLTKEEFAENDPSITYPISGLYSKFLWEKLGTSGYKRFYQKYSGTELQVDTMRIDSIDLPPQKEWMDFVHEEASKKTIEFKLRAVSQRAKDSYVTEDSSELYFRVKDTLLITPRTGPSFSYSRKFTELFPSRKYNGEKYAIIATASGISVYNLFTGNLVASYVESFNVPPLAVPNENGDFQFSIPKKIFDEEIANWNLRP